MGLEEFNEATEAVGPLLKARQHMCGLSEGRVLCWGDTADARLGFTTAPFANHPLRLDLQMDVGAAAQ